MLQVVPLNPLRGGGERKAFECKPFLGGDGEQLGAIPALDAVVALFQLAAPRLLRIFGDGLGARLGALAHAPALKYEFVRPNFRVLAGPIYRHTIFLPRC